MTTITSLNFAPTHLGNEDFRYYTDQDRAENWAPAHVWSWLSCGKTSQHVTIVGGRIEAADDVSGNDRDWAKAEGITSLDYSDGWAEGGEGDWETDLPVLHRGGASGAAGAIELLSPLNATGEFYLGHALLNSRGAGNRYMYGADSADDTIIIRQEQNQLRIVIDGGSEISFTNTGMVAVNPVSDPMFLEIWRDSSDVMRVAVNLVEVGNDAVASGTFPISAFGGLFATSSRWDDVLLETWVGTSLPTMQERREAYNYLRVKWGF